MNDEDRKNLATVIELLKGLTIESKGLRKHVSSAQDFHDDRLKEIWRLVVKIAERDDKERQKRGKTTWPGDSR